MHIIKLFGVGVIFCLPGAVSAQSNFIQPSVATATDEIPTNVVELPTSSLIFSGVRLKAVQAGVEARPMLIKTNADGDTQKQISVTPFGISRFEMILGLYYFDQSLYAVGVHSDSTDSTNTIPQWISWRRLDTSLNLISQRSVRVINGLRQIIDCRLTERSGSIYGAVVTDTLSLQGPFETYLIALTHLGGVRHLKKIDSTFFNYTGKTVGSVWMTGIDVEESTARIVVNGSVGFLSSGSPSQYIQPHQILWLDSNLVLTDTAQVGTHVIPPGMGPDTTFSTTGWEAILINPSAVLVGPKFYDHRSPSIGYIGVSKYDLELHKHQISALIPKLSLDDVNIVGPTQRSLVRSGPQHMYVFGATWDESINVIFEQSDSRLLLARYDTSGSLIWWRSFGQPGVRYTPCHIKALSDGSALLLTGAYDYMNSSSPQRDFYILKIDSSGTPTAVFQLPTANRAEAATVFPNPATTTLHIRLPKTVGTASNLTLYNTAGTAVRQTTFTGAETSVSIADLPPGVYIYRITSTDKAGFAGSGLFLKR